MNATKLLAKYEMLAEAAHKTGAYACARKWSVKAEKLAAVISVLETIETEVKMISLEKAQEIYGDPEAIERGYITKNSVKVAFEMASELEANGFTARDGMCIFPNVWHIAEKFESRLNKKERRSLNCLGAYFMGSVVNW